MTRTTSVTYLARTNHRNTGTLFGIQQKDRRSHIYVVGKTGTGKTTLLRTVIEQDLRCRRGAAVFDPHGDLSRELREFTREVDREEEVVYVCAHERSNEWKFNPFAGIPDELHSLAAAGIVDVFKKIWSDDWGPRLEHLLRNVVYTLLAVPGATIGDIPPLLNSKSSRRSFLEHVKNEVVRDYWFEEFEKYSSAFRAVVVAPLQNKIGALLTDPLLNSFFTGTGKYLQLRDIMDRQKLLIVNLDKGRIGEGPASILGSFLVSHIALAGLSRSDLPEESRKDFHVFLDEFQTFSTLSLATMLAELRKYRVCMVLAHQYLGQLESEIRDAVLGNCGTLISFRLGAQDARVIAQELSPPFEASDFTSLPNYSMYLRLLIDGEPSRPFSATTLASIDELPL